MTRLALAHRASNSAVLQPLCLRFSVLTRPPPPLLFAAQPVRHLHSSRLACASDVAAAASLGSCVRVHGKSGHLLLSLSVKPGARQTDITEVTDTALHLRVSAAPVDGAANTAVIAWLAKNLLLRKSSISIAHGSTGRQKSIEIDPAANNALTAEELLRRIHEYAQAAGVDAK